MFVRPNNLRRTAPMDDLTGFLPFWEGFVVDDMAPIEGRMQLRLSPDGSQPARCGGCSAVGLPVHEDVERRVRDLPMVGYPVTLEIRLRRVLFPRFGQRVGTGGWLGRPGPLTPRGAPNL